MHCGPKAHCALESRSWAEEVGVTWRHFSPGSCFCLCFPAVLSWAVFPSHPCCHFARSALELTKHETMTQNKPLLLQVLSAVHSVPEMGKWLICHANATYQVLARDAGQWENKRHSDNKGQNKMICLKMAHRKPYRSYRKTIRIDSSMS